MRNPLKVTLIGALVLAAAASTADAGTVACDYYASPTGGGDGRTSSAPFQIRNFWPLATAGTALCLLDGTYRGDASMIYPPVGLSGSPGNPITISAVTDGGALIDGQFARYPVHLSGGNSWFVLEGFNAQNGSLAVIRNAGGSNNNIYRRIVAWDTDIRLNSSVLFNISSDATLLEDAAFFGTGATLIQHTGNKGGLTCRRCWGRWEGSTTTWSHKIVFDLGYETTPNGVCENCLVTASSESMPSSFTVTDGDGGTTPNPICTSQTTSTSVPCPGPLLRIRSSVTNNTKNARLLGSLIYLRSTDIWNAPSGMMTIPSYGADVSGVHVRHVLTFIAPSNPNFGRTWGIDLNQATTAPTDLVADRITSVAALDRFTSKWTVTNNVHGTSLAAVPSPWTGSSGAQLCHRWVDGQVTTTPLWPWPMNERIKAATADAGAYAGPCLGCSGGRAARTPTDVQSQIEGLLGTIPSECFPH